MSTALPVEIIRDNITPFTLPPGIEDTEEFKRQLGQLKSIKQKIEQPDGETFELLVFASTKKMSWHYEIGSAIHRLANEDEYGCTPLYMPNFTRVTHVPPPDDLTLAIGEHMYNHLIALIKEYRAMKTCTRCTKRRRLMNKQPHCVGCCLAPLADE